MDSSRFSTGAKIKDSWYMHLKIKKDKDGSKNKSWVSIYLCTIIKDRKVRTKFKFFFLNNERKKIINDCTVNNKSDVWMDHLFDYSTFSGWGFPEFVKIDTLLEKENRFLQYDTLIVSVDLTVYDDYVAVNSPNYLLEGSERKLSDDFKNLFETKNKCDITIKVGDKKFEAHKVILIARSSVFNAMFSHDMKENKENEVTIPDINPEIFKKVLDYIYIDKAEDLFSFTEELLEAADKYQLLGLKDLCECSLSKTLSPGNAVKILILADRHFAK
ncbi:GSCOCG00009892001-RA-CDS [Cotesia congregata]|nr:GSCOCG00009892001-RA-CDS [Cotesia congregata]